MTENIVQAIAKDCLVESLKRFKTAGYQTMMRIHDECVLDVAKGKADLKALTDIMGYPIARAQGQMLKADGYEIVFYKKE